MTSDPSNYHREYSPYGSYSLFQFEGSDVISVLKNSIEYSSVFFKGLLILPKISLLCDLNKIFYYNSSLQQYYKNHALC